jgi:hypothetical protein
LTDWCRCEISRQYDTDQISNDIGMSRQMVAHYMRFKDQMGIVADGRKHLKPITQEG